MLNNTMLCKCTMHNSLFTDSIPFYQPKDTTRPVECTLERITTKVDLKVLRPYLFRRTKQGGRIGLTVHFNSIVRRLARTLNSGLLVHFKIMVLHGLSYTMEGMVLIISHLDHYYLKDK